MYHTARMSTSKFLQVTVKSLWTYVVLGLLVFYALLYLVLDLPANLEDFASVNPLRTLLGALATGLNHRSGAGIHHFPGGGAT